MNSALAALDSPGLPVEQTAAGLVAGAAAGRSAAAELTAQESDQVRALQSRISQMQRRKLDTTALSTLDAFAPLLPGGALQTGVAYAVSDSMSLVMGLLAGPSRSGAWCGVVGVPEFGVEAAARFGIDLERLVLIPEPGTHWLTVTAALADALTVVVTRPATRVSDADAARLSARLRGKETTLIALGEWPRSEVSLTVAASSWDGLGRGHGYPVARQLTVVASGRGGVGRSRSARLWLPDEHDAIRAVDSTIDELPRTLEAVV
ncbi:hypothetical protein [Rathayibacter soli]|uniref:hypothetical protein n=1 Tax=Rathayibacter soli TaxID=3144168 RepID=UPI0027E4475F|nr:hypothetical protein [Glaciibacter superstes]